MSKKLFAVALILSFAAVAFAADAITPLPEGMEALRSSDASGTTPVEGGGVSWFYSPNEASGWYWMYDNLSPPPFSSPSIPGLPSFQDVTGGNKIAPYSDDPYKYTMPDSFWYYGSWYTAEKPNYLYISPDGWVSFDPAAAAGFPTPPSVSPPFPYTDAPNAIIAPLWQDMNPTQSPEPSDTNRVYYMYMGFGGTVPPGIYVEWYETQGNGNTHVYDFEVHLATGGQIYLMTEGACGVVFSYHFIDFMYESATAGWTADNGKTGIEDYTGEHGIYYQGNISNGRRIRAGYKRIFKNDVKVTRFLSPASTVLRWTEIEPKVEVSNVGQETESFSVTIDVYDETNDSLVYHFNMSGFDLLPGEFDTLVGPCWEPGELTVPDTHSYLKVAYTMLGRDLCKHNDTLTEVSIVSCDGWLTPYHWNLADFPNAIAYYNYRMATSYDMNNGTYVLGGRVFMGAPDGSLSAGTPPPRIEVWGSQNGCGGVPNGSFALGGGDAINPAEALVWNEVIFDNPVWCPTANPGNFWIAAAHPIPDGPPWMGWIPWLGLSPPPDPSSCHPSSTRRSGYWIAINGGPSTGFTFNDLYGYNNHTHPIEALTHLGFSPMPAPPCYYDLAHDLTCYRMEDPSGEYVEADVAITPKLAIANIGLQAEPDADFFDVQFIVVNEQTSDTVFNETSLVGGPFVMGDTTFGTTLPWTPEGLCDELDPSVSYELIGLVLLGEVGPDLSDHCPYNDTVRNHVTCLLSHDVGVINMTWPELPDEDPDFYDPGSKITVTATVENFGFNAEHDVEVRLEVLDLDSNGVELWHALTSIGFLDWRGNAPGNPHTVDVLFPTYDVLTERHYQSLTCRTELVNDACPKDDAEVRYINTGIAETPAGLPFALEAITPNPFVGSTTISFAVPATVNVSLKVYDVTGKLVTTLVSGNQAPGHHTVTWNGTDDLGRSVAQGIYLVRMDATNFSATKKVVLY
jgi:hypothetical protein